jgi:hypothetical protein
MDRRKFLGGLLAGLAWPWGRGLEEQAYLYPQP